jgi:hypothetical protein
MLIVAVNDSITSLPYDCNQAKVKEDQVKILGDAAELQPSMSDAVEPSLAPGSHLLICIFQVTTLPEWPRPYD